MDHHIIDTIDPELGQVIEKELERQKYTLELIASENIVSRAVMAVQGSVLTNKYAEGYPDKRYYGGCEHVMLLKIWRVSEPRNCSIALMPTCSLIRVRKPTKQCSLR